MKEWLNLPFKMERTYLGSRPKGTSSDELALRLSAYYGNTETVKLLLDRGARIHA